MANISFTLKGITKEIKKAEKKLRAIRGKVAAADQKKIDLELRGLARVQRDLKILQTARALRADVQDQTQKEVTPCAVAERFETGALHIHGIGNAQEGESHGQDCFFSSSDYQRNSQGGEEVARHSAESQQG